jgi:hypothetical protein
LYKQANIGFAAEAVFFLGGERGRFAQKKGCKADAYNALSFFNFFLNR